MMGTREAPIRLSIHASTDEANAAAADCLADWLADPGTRTVMAAAGNTPIELYRRIAEHRIPLGALTAFALDEYIGVPLDEPRRCANLLRRCVQQAWGIPADQLHTVSSLEAEALASILAHEGKIAAAGGIDVLVLGLGRNGHVGFNEPGSAADCSGRVLDLDAASVEANREWFGGDYAPTRGVTVELKTIFAAKRILIMAFGPHKIAAVRAMVQGGRAVRCPASLLQGHPGARLFLDREAASGLESLA
jgi:glucosamine-6-phosphate deaminase